MPDQLDFLDLLAAETPSPMFEHQPSDEELFLPGLPAELIRQYYAAAPGNEIGSGKFSHPESSAALVANSFGIFLDRPDEMPPIPSCERFWSPPSFLSLEATLRFPWNEGRHPCLDVLVVTNRAAFGIESKRFEPYRDRPPASFSNAYLRRVWGNSMDGYEFVRDMVRGAATIFARLDAAQLVKHAFALRTATHRNPRLRGKRPVLVYLYAEPTHWPDGRSISVADAKTHDREIRRFSKCVSDSEVLFKPVSYRKLLFAWRSSALNRIRVHAAAVMSRYQVG